MLFLCNRQDGDMKEWCDESLQKAPVKKSKTDIKTNTYNVSPLSLFLVLEKLISLFADRAPRVHP
ncbi:Secreted protein [Burkholderia sp. IT-111MI5]